MIELARGRETAEIARFDSAIAEVARLTLGKPLSIRSHMNPCPELAEFAEELAHAARTETLARWLRTCTVEDKGTSGFDPVTDADREAERAMRQLIRSRYPDHGATGEEGKDEPASGPFSWSLDPVDGTRSFICGVPTWTTLIALLEDGRPLLGLIDAPCLEETYVGFRGQAYLRKKDKRMPLRTSSCCRVADARLSTTDPFLFSSNDAQMFNALRKEVRTVRYGCDGYAYARLAAGTLDLVIESGLKPHDYQALIPVVSAAGGVIGDWRGEQVFSGGNIIAASTPALFEEALGYFRDCA